MQRAIVGIVTLLGALWTPPGARLAAVDNTGIFAARRLSLMAKISGARAILKGAIEPRSYTPFRQDDNFYYLTGLETPGAFLLVDADNKRSTLFLPPRDPHLEAWEGLRLFAGAEAHSATGVEEILDSTMLPNALEKIKGDGHPLYMPQSPEETAATSRDRALQHDSAREHDRWDGRISQAKAFLGNLKRVLGDAAEIRDLAPILDDMRRRKDSQEIDRMRESARIGSLGLKEAMRAAAPGHYEYQLAALAEMIFRWHGAMGPAYFSIVGSGPNSCVIHYNANTRKLQAGDLVVMDCGPDYGYYASDITRTFPASGRFSPEQARMYQIVLESQKAALAKVRPGASFGAIADAAKEVLARHDLLKYLPHGISHYVGMSTHDVGDIVPLEPGVVLTVEPGIYVPEKNVGIRIEDTVLVTRDGYEVLSRDVPKEIREIEKLMAERGTSLPEWQGK
jgi:Xaa-Pro aminopeptidase